MLIIYDSSFNKNEIFILVLLTAGLILVWKLKKIFSFKEGLIYFLFGVFIGLLADHTISIKPIDYYDVNDSNAFQFMDFLTYVMYGPYSYAFAHFYRRFKVKLSYTPLYILLWSLFSLFAEFVSKSVGIFHYKNGYTIYYSFPIYLLTFSIEICLYRFFTNKKTLQDK